MSITKTIQSTIAWISLNRPEKLNAFNEEMIQALTQAIKSTIQDPTVHIIVLTAVGKHFSAGADLNWMYQMSKASVAENQQDAQRLATLLHTIYHCPKPTIVQIQGTAYGGGLGLIAACDIAIAESEASFCFSEINLGLIPATISPFIIKAIGSRVARWLFLSAEKFDAHKALSLNLIHHVVSKTELEPFTQTYVSRLALLPQSALLACKSLVTAVEDQPINQTLLIDTANRLAKQRQSPEAKALIQHFCQKD